MWRAPTICWLGAGRQRASLIKSRGVQSSYEAELVSSDDTVSFGRCNQFASDSGLRPPPIGVAGAETIGSRVSRHGSGDEDSRRAQMALRVLPASRACMTYMDRLI